MQEQFQKKKLLALEKINISKSLLFDLKKYFIIKENNKKNLQNLKDVNAIYTKFNYLINDKFIKKTPSLKYIISNVTGLDRVDEKFSKKKGIKIFSLKGEEKFLKNITSTAEFTFALIFALLKKIPHAHNSMLNKKSNRYDYLGQNLYKKTLGIIGFGRNGKLISRYGKAFGMDVLSTDKKKMKGNISFKKVLAHSDIISINVDLNKSTKNLINKQTLKIIKKNCFIINTSRAEIINQKDLILILKKNKIGGFASDFLEQKNLKYTNSSKKIINLAKIKKNIILTPHIGGATKESLTKTEEFVFKKLISYEKKIIHKR